MDFRGEAFEVLGGKRKEGFGVKVVVQKEGSWSPDGKAEWVSVERGWDGYPEGRGSGPKR